MAGLIHTFLTPQVIPLIFSELRAVYEGPVVQTQDLTVFNVTKEAVVVRQARVVDQLPPIEGEQRVEYTPVPPPPPEWWADELIPLEDVEALAAVPATP
jgi:ribonuclease Z